MTDKKPAESKTAKTAPKAASKSGSKDRGLGRGLSALMSDVGALSTPLSPSLTTPPISALETKSEVFTGAEISRGISLLAINQLVRNPDQPRRFFDAAMLAELTQSIKDKGILQPILVRPVADRSAIKEGGLSATKPLYQIVAGERRWQAALKAGLPAMPALIRTLSDQEVLEIGVIENVQRADLNPIEEAQAYRALMTQFNRTQQDISDAIGKSRPHIANMLRLLTLPVRAQEALKTGEISTGHARAIVASPDPDSLVAQIIEQNLSVRDAEDRVRALKKQQSGGLPDIEKSEKSPDIRALEADLRDALGLIVDLRHKGPGGELRIKYRSDAQLETVLERLKHR